MKTSTWLMFSLPVLACLGLATSCRTPGSGIIVESYPKNTITINSKVVGEQMSVTEITAARHNGLLRAQVRAQNLTQRDLQMEYRFRWLDQHGMETDTRTAIWVPLNVNAKDVALMQGIAPAKEDEDFILDLRFRRPGTRWE